MLYKGWRKLLGELVSRNGSCLEAACVPFAGLAIVFWPLIVVASAVSAILCSPLMGLYSAIVVYQVCNLIFTLRSFVSNMCSKRSKLVSIIVPP